MRKFYALSIGLSVSAVHASETCLDALLVRAAPIIAQFEQAATTQFPHGGISVSAASLYAAHRTGFLPERGNIWEMPEPRGMVSLENKRVGENDRRLISSLLEQSPHVSITFNKAIDRVIDGCAAMPRDSDPWMTSEVVAAYKELGRLGFVYSVELWDGEHLAAGNFGMVSNNHVQGISKFRDLAHSLANGGGILIQEAENYYFWSQGLKDIDVEVAKVKGTDHVKRGVKGLPQKEFSEWLKVQNAVAADFFPGAKPDQPLPVVESNFPTRFLEMKAAKKYSYDGK